MDKTSNRSEAGIRAKYFSKRKEGVGRSDALLERYCALKKHVSLWVIKQKTFLVWQII